MKAIICGTDFSQQAQEAEAVAAALASKLQCPLQLVHVVDVVIADAALLGLREALIEAQRVQLEGRAEVLRRAFGGSISTIVVEGRVFDQVIREGQACGAELVVVGSLGGGQQRGWLLGSNAERVAQHSPVPVLVVRSAQPLLDWIVGPAPLQTLVCADMTDSSRAALRWVRGLQRVGPCHTELTYVAWPPAERSPAGGVDLAREFGSWSALEASLTDDLRAWAADADSVSASETYRVLVNWGRTDAALTLHASAVHSALIVAGTHRRSYAARLWQGSVTRGLLHHAETNVVCVPPTDTANMEVAAIKRVVAAVDLSNLDGDVLRTAFGVVPLDGEVHVLHAIDRDSEPAVEREALGRLEALLAPLQPARRAVTHIAVRRGDSPHAIIAAYAERMAADAICMGNKRRGHAAQLLPGPQLQGVLKSARVPIILVPSTRE